MPNGLNNPTPPPAIPTVLIIPYVNCLDTGLSLPPDCDLRGQGWVCLCLDQSMCFSWCPAPSRFSANISVTARLSSYPEEHPLQVLHSPQDATVCIPKQGSSSTLFYLSIF